MGRDILLEIDWQGALQVRKLIPSAIGVFILPPSLDALRRRLTARGQDSSEVIERRLANAREEISHLAEFDYVIINRVFEVAVVDQVSIVRAQPAARRPARAPRRSDQSDDEMSMPWHASPWTIA